MSVRVLIVEDEAPDRAHHVAAVRDVVPQAEIVEAETMTAALRALEGPPFELALIDLNLRGNRRAGERIVQAMRQIGETAIIVISGLDVDTYRPMVFEHDIWDYFEKPVDAGSLRMVVARSLRRLDADAARQRGPIIVDELVWHPEQVAPPTWRGEPVRLSQTEQKLLVQLVRTPDRLVRRETLYDCFERWDRDPRLLRASLSTAIYQIRKAFTRVDPQFDRIDAVGSVGYLWRSG
jgi:DNA-binding response OmpR family regulator